MTCQYRNWLLCKTTQLAFQSIFPGSTKSANSTISLSTPTPLDPYTPSPSTSQSGKMSPLPPPWCHNQVQYFHNSFQGIFSFSHHCVLPNPWHRKTKFKCFKFIVHILSGKSCIVQFFLLTWGCIVLAWYLCWTFSNAYFVLHILCCILIAVLFF